MHKSIHLSFCRGVRILILGASLVCALTVCGSVRAQAVDLALVLVIDNSGSIDPSESALQFGGYAAAFRSPEIVKEMTAGPNGAVAVSVLLFSDTVQSLGGWRIINGLESATLFANLLSSASSNGSGGTHIAQALEAAVMELSSCPYPASAATIDLSGDGPDNEGEVLNIGNIFNLVLAIAGAQTINWTPQTQQNAYRLRNLRNSIAARGVSINCVAIQDPDLQDYFEKYVVCGKGSFAMLASSFQSFRTVIKRKILREVQQGIKQSRQRTSKKPPATPSKATQPKPDGRAKKSEPLERDHSAVPEQDNTLVKQGNAELKAGSQPLSGEMLAIKKPTLVSKEIIITVRDSETKLPVGDVRISLVGPGTDFQAEPHGSLPGQFLTRFDALEGADNSLRVDARGYMPKDVLVDNRNPARYEIELNRLPVRFVL